MANECRRVCGVTRRPERAAPAYRPTSRRMSRRPIGRTPAVHEQLVALGAAEHAALGQPGSDRIAREVAERYLALLVALADHLDPAAFEVDPIERETGDLAHPEPGPVEELEDRAVAKRHRDVDLARVPGDGRRLDERRGLGDAEHHRQPVDDLRPPEERSRVLARRRSRDTAQR